MIKKRAQDIGLSPYDLVYRGNKKLSESRINYITYNKSEVKNQNISSIDEIQLSEPHENIQWITIEGINNVELMQALSQKFGLDTNILSEVLNPSARARIINFENGSFISMKMLEFESKNCKVEVENFCFVILNNIILSFHEDDSAKFEPVRERIRKSKTKIRTSGTDYLAFALIDIIIDHYIYVVGQLGDKIEDLEEDLTSNPTSSYLEQINQHKRELNLLRKSIKPVKDLIMSLNKSDNEFIKTENKIHYKELQDNIDDAIEISDSYHETLYDLLNIYHSTIATRLNEIMRVLTIISVIFIPITFIVGVYGTNFKNIPELNWEYGYQFLWAVMLLVCIIMVIYFRKKKWI